MYNAQDHPTEEESIHHQQLIFKEALTHIIMLELKCKDVHC